VNYGAADAYSGNLIAGGIIAAPFAVFGPAVSLDGDAQQAVFEVLPDGTLRRIH
jgi:hypothetical protein